MWPISSTASSRFEPNLIILLPSSLIFITSPSNPSNFTFDPSLNFLPGLTRHSQVVPSIFLVKRTSPKSPNRRAFNTLESLKTSTEFSGRISGKSRNFLCEISPVSRLTTISREWSRGVAGSLAMSSSGSV